MRVIRCQKIAICQTIKFFNVNKTFKFDFQTNKPEFQLTFN